jgi:ribonucleoside-diphosphate reductase alpha chain
MAGIFETLKQMALVRAPAAGPGFRSPKLRPRATSSIRPATKPRGRVLHADLDCATENIKQGGRRRGANLGVLRIDHPDILEFVRAGSTP